MERSYKFELVYNLGDVNPLDHGGVFIYEEVHNKCVPEMEILEIHDYNDEIFRYRFSLNVYSGSDWFTNDLESVSSFVGMSKSELVTLLRSDNSIDRGIAYHSIGLYFGFNNFSNPYIMTRKEAEEEYSEYNFKEI